MNVDTVTMGHVVLDDLHRPDGTSDIGVLGGAGTYAALGQALVSSRTGVVSGIGEDFPASATKIFERASVDRTGLVVMDPRTPRTLVQYFPDGERHETSTHGSDHFSRLDPSWDLLPTNYRRARGFYVFDAINPGLWRSLREQKNRGATILWEIRADICRPEYLEQIGEQLCHVDYLSINKTELLSLTQAHNLPEALELLSPLVNGIALRLGADGALVRTANTEITAGPLADTIAVDPTGAGNSFSGAFLAQLTLSGSPTPQRDEEALRAGMAAAALTITQVGVPDVNDEMRLTHKHLMQSFPIESRTCGPNKTEWKTN